MGFLVAAELRIIPAKEYVCIKYTPVYSKEKLVEEFASASANPENEFVEGLVFSEDKAVIMTGTMVDKIEDGKVSLTIHEGQFRHSMSSCSGHKH